MDTQQSLPRFDVELLSIGPEDKETLERSLQRVRGLCASPSEIVNSYPCLIASNISGTASKKLQIFLKKLGAEVAIRGNHPPQKNPQTLPKRTSVSAENTKAKEQQLAPAQKGRKVSGNTTSEAAAAPAITLKRSVGELTQALRDKDWTVRKTAIIDLSATPSQGVIQHIIGALKDDIWQVRCTALEVLGQIGSGMALKEMIKCIEDDVWQVRLQAVESLYRIQSDKAVKALMSALNDENWQVRLKALWVLGELRTKRSLNGVLTCLQDEVWQVRRSAAEVLGKLQSDKSVKALTQTLHDPNWQVRSMVVTALWRIGDERSVQALLDALNDEEWRVHWKVAYALGKIGTPEMLPILSRLGQTTDTTLRDASIRALNSLELVTTPKEQAIIRGEFRSEAPYSNMKYIAAGECLIGHNDGPEDAGPASRLQLDAYFIDCYEVTNSQYAVFNPSHEYPPGMEQFPVVNVTWEEAQAYAKWIGKRLPTEAEWEKAARGSDGRKFPWGNEFDPANCNTLESGKNTLTPVNHYPGGVSAFGVYDMVGNVLEWTADRYKAYPWSHYDHPDFDEDFIVLRGGSWIHPASRAPCFTRFYAPAENRSNFIGFRCVKDVAT